MKARRLLQTQSCRWTKPTKEAAVHPRAARFVRDFFLYIFQNFSDVVFLCFLFLCFFFFFDRANTQRDPPCFLKATQQKAKTTEPGTELPPPALRMLLPKLHFLLCLRCRNRSPAENTPRASRIPWSWLVSGRTKGRFFIRALTPDRTPSRRGGGGRGAQSGMRGGAETTLGTTAEALHLHNKLYFSRAPVAYSLVVPRLAW